APALFQWIDRNRMGILIVALLIFFVLPNFFQTGISVGTPITGAADWLWGIVVTGRPPLELFPNLSYLIAPSNAGLASALSNPCLSLY
ncbi:MAG: hypothetical protein ACREN7_08230, partial [Candidatus Dormibacteria bacterium]